MLQRTLAAGFIAPCLPSKTDKLPSGSEWLHVAAAQALGMTYLQTMGYIVLPQAFRNMVPVLLTQTIILFQDTSCSRSRISSARRRKWRSATGAWWRCTCSRPWSTSRSRSQLRSSCASCSGGSRSSAEDFPWSRVCPNRRPLLLLLASSVARQKTGTHRHKVHRRVAPMTIKTIHPQVAMVLLPMKCGRGFCD